MITKLNKDINNSIKINNLFRASVLKMLKAEFIVNEKSKKPVEEDQLVKSYCSKLNKNLEVYKKLNKDTPEMYKEIEIIKEYIPKEMSDEELVDFIELCFKIHDYEEFNAGQIISKIKNATKHSNGKLIAETVKKFVDNRK